MHEGEKPELYLMIPAGCRPEYSSSLSLSLSVLTRDNVKAWEQTFGFFIDWGLRLSITSRSRESYGEASWLFIAPFLRGVTDVGPFPPWFLVISCLIRHLIKRTIFRIPSSHLLFIFFWRGLSCNRRKFDKYHFQNVRELFLKYSEKIEKINQLHKKIIIFWYLV